MTKIVGLLGAMGAGKDTAGAILVKHGFVRLAFADGVYEETAEAFGVTVAFLRNRETKETPLPELALKNCSNLLYRCVALEVVGLSASVSGRYFDALGDLNLLRPAVAELLRVALDAPRSPRFILQLWGTEFRRVHFGESYWRDQVRVAIEANPTASYVLTDVRFPDEASFIESLGGELNRVTRPAHEVAGEISPTFMHPSERSLSAWPVHQTFVNMEGAPEFLQHMVLRAHAPVQQRAV